MTVAEGPQHLRALARANAIRHKAAHQRHALVGQPPSVVLPALRDPSAELATYRLSTLFGKPSLIEGIGNYVLRKALRDVEACHPHGRRWHAELRLDELTRSERKRLVEAITKRAPKKAWSEAA